MNTSYTAGKNCIINETASIGKNVVFGHNCIIEANVQIGDNTYIDSNTIVRNGTQIGENSFVGANCIIGEYLMDFCVNRTSGSHTLKIGKNAIDSEWIDYLHGFCYGGGISDWASSNNSRKTKIGNHVSVGTLSDIQGNCAIGNYVRDAQ